MKTVNGIDIGINELDMWSFYEPGDWPVAKTNTDFIWFLLSPNTQSMEIVDLDCDHITFALWTAWGRRGSWSSSENTRKSEYTARRTEAHSRRDKR